MQPITAIIDPNNTPINVQPIMDAATGKHWLLLGALLVGAIVALAKQGWLSTWLATKLSPKALPWVALGLSITGTMSVEIVQGKTWQQAITDGAIIAFAAVFGHQAVIEGARNGKEIVPETRALTQLKTRLAPTTPPSAPAPVDKAA